MKEREREWEKQTIKLLLIPSLFDLGDKNFDSPRRIHSPLYTHYAQSHIISDGRIRSDLSFERYPITTKNHSPKNIQMDAALSGIYPFFFLCVLTGRWFIYSFHHLSIYFITFGLSELLFYSFFLKEMFSAIEFTPGHKSLLPFHILWYMIVLVVSDRQKHDKPLMVASTAGANKKKIQVLYYWDLQQSSSGDLIKGPHSNKQAESETALFLTHKHAHIYVCRRPQLFWLSIFKTFNWFSCEKKKNWICHFFLSFLLTLLKRDSKMETGGRLQDRKRMKVAQFYRSVANWTENCFILQVI